MKKMSRYFIFTGRSFGLLLILMMSSGCGGRIAYKAEEINAFSERKAGVELRFLSSYGIQSAYYIFPQKSGEKIPARLVMAYPGISELALGWLNFISNIPDRDAGFLLIEYPGRGNSQGRFLPKYLVESSSGALKALCDYLDCPQQELTKNLLFLAHSFGCGEALQFARETLPKRMVLIAPFNTLRKVAFKQVGPLAWFIPDMDNCEKIRELCSLPDPPKIVIFHGAADETLPVSMSRDLTACSPGCVEYHEIEGAGHTDILQSEWRMIVNALFDS